MNVLIAGSHGGIGSLLAPLLVDAGHKVFGSVRDPEQFATVRALGATPVLLDVTEDVGEQLGDLTDSLDAIVFAIGAGPGSGPEKKETVDHQGSDRLVELAEKTDIRRYLMISSQGAHDPSAAGDDFRPYLEAKLAADERLRASSLDWTIVRPGSLTDEPGTGMIRATTQLGNRGEIARADVAAALAEILPRPDLHGITLELFSGSDPIPGFTPEAG